MRDLDFRPWHGPKSNINIPVGHMYDFLVVVNGKIVPHLSSFKKCSLLNFEILLTSIFDLEIEDRGREKKTMPIAHLMLS